MLQVHRPCTVTLKLRCAPVGGGGKGAARCTCAIASRSKSAFPEDRATDRFDSPPLAPMVKAMTAAPLNRVAGLRRRDRCRFTFCGYSAAARPSLAELPASPRLVVDDWPRGWPAVSPRRALCSALPRWAGSGRARDRLRSGCGDGRDWRRRRGDGDDRLGRGGGGQGACHRIFETGADHRELRRAAEAHRLGRGHRGQPPCMQAG